MVGIRNREKSTFICSKLNIIHTPNEIICQEINKLRVGLDVKNMLQGW